MARDWLNKNVSTGASSDAHSFRTRGEMASGPDDFFVSKLVSNLMRTGLPECRPYWGERL